MRYLISSATFSPCHTWRYLLERGTDEWPLVNFICLNPSMADATEDDPTVRRCWAFAQRWGFSRMLITNLFAYRATNPKALALCQDPIGPENERYILDAASWAKLVVCAWGNSGRRYQRGVNVEGMLRKNDIMLYHLGLTKGARKDKPMPKHPLYLPAETKPQEYPEAGGQT